MTRRRVLGALRGLVDPALPAAWGRLVRLWKPMAAWSALVWAAVAVVLAPLLSAALGWPWLRGGQDVVANDALIAWALTPGGIAWLVLAGSLTLTGFVLHYAGIYEIVTEDREGTPASVPGTALRLAPRVPALVRLCAAAVLAGLAAALVLGLGLAAVHRLFLSARDINYYLAERPAAWWYAVVSGAAWSLAWGAAVAWLAARSLLALPAYLDGHRPLPAALRRSWRHTHGEGARVVRAVAAAVAAWLGVRALLDAGVVAAGSAVVRWTASASASLGPVVAATGGWALVTLAVDSAVAFLGIAFVSVVVTELYHENTDLHAAADVPTVRELSGRARSLVARWLRPSRALPGVAAVLLLSSAAGGYLLEQIPEPRPVAIIAHRAGPPPAPENTLAALEESVRKGAGWAEIDVQLTRDSVPVVLHDADLMRVAGDPRRVSRTRYRELEDLVQGSGDAGPARDQRVATLGEFLARAGDRIGLLVELKYYGWDPRLAEEVARALDRDRGPGRVMVMSLELRAVRQLRELGVGVPVGYAAAAAVGEPSRLPVDFLALSRSAASPRQIRAAHRRGVEVHVWTVNRAVGMAEVILEGADGLITDRPALAARVERELAGMPAVSRLALRVGDLLTEPWEDEDGTGDTL